MSFGRFSRRLAVAWCPENENRMLLESFVRQLKYQRVAASIKPLVRILSLFSPTCEMPQNFPRS